MYLHSTVDFILATPKHNVDFAENGFFVKTLIFLHFLFLVFSSLLKTTENF